MKSDISSTQGTRSVVPALREQKAFGFVVGVGLGPGCGGGGGDCRGGCLIACEFAGAAPGGRAAAQRGRARGVAGACVRWWVTVRARPPGYA